MKSLTLHLDERAYGALLMAAPDATAPGLAAFAREALGKMVDCAMEDTKEGEVAALFTVEPAAEEEAPAATRTVAVELSGFGAGLLQMVMAHDGHATAADAFRAMLAFAGGSLCACMGREADGVAGRLAPEREDGGDALATAANRSDLPLVAAAKPPKRQP